VSRGLVAILFIALCGCGDDPDAAASYENITAKPLTAAELGVARAASQRSYEAFLKSPDEAIETQLGACKSAILDELKRDHLNAMLADKPGRNVVQMKRDASEALKRLTADPSSPGLDVFMESVNFCTFDRLLNERLVQQGSAFCEFKDGKYIRHGIGSLAEVPKGLVYTCDGYGL
jgi:hypothetical protein